MSRRPHTCYRGDYSCCLACECEHLEAERHTALCERDEARQKNANLIEENLRLTVEMDALTQAIDGLAEIIERLEAGAALDGLARHAISEYYDGKTRPMEEFIAELKDADER